MTAASADNTTASGVPLHKRFHWKALIGPSIGLALFVSIFGGKALDKIGGPEATASATPAAMKEAVRDGFLEAIPTTAPPAPAPTPEFDELACSHVGADKTIPCTPLYPWPLTDGAMKMIGWQNGGSARQLNGVNTHEIVVQLLAMRGVDPCTVLLGLKFDDAGMQVLTTYRGKAGAPVDALSLYDCTPRAGVTTGTLDTEGTS